MKDFNLNPFQYIDSYLEKGISNFRVPSGALYLSQSKLVSDMFNDTGLFQESSDFYTVDVRKGMLHEETQKFLNKTVMNHLKRSLGECKSKAIMEIGLISSKELVWPASGVRLMSEIYREAIIGRNPSDNLSKLYCRIVETSIINKDRKRKFLSHTLYSWNVNRVIKRELHKSDSNEKSILSIVASAPKITIDEKVSLFISFLFSIVATQAFTLSWVFYLMEQNDSYQASASSLLMESMRVWPVAWNSGRVAKKEIELEETKIKEGEQVVACTYALHRNKELWSCPHQFLPDRWEAKPKPSTYAPFGMGKHKCVAEHYSIDWLTFLIDSIKDKVDVVVQDINTPIPSPMLAPPEFKMKFRNES